jgi:hypothetical protein
MTQAGIEYTILYGAIGSLVTAIIFLYNRTSRMEIRLVKQLKDESEKCEEEKVRMFAFTTSLLTYITSLTRVSCSASDCPIRKNFPAMPQPTAADMGLRKLGK